jgi:hypothetical protein
VAVIRELETTVNAAGVPLNVTLDAPLAVNDARICHGAQICPVWRK